MRVRFDDNTHDNPWEREGRLKQFLNNINRDLKWALIYSETKNIKIN